MQQSATQTPARTRKTVSPITEAAPRQRELDRQAPSAEVAVCVGVFLLAVILRALWLVLMGTQHDATALLYQAPDSWRYVQIGTQFAGQAYEGPEPGWHSGPIYATPEGSVLWSGPGYGLFLAAIFAIFGAKAWPVLIIQVVLSSANCGLIYLLARRLQLSKRVGIIAGLIAALSLTSISLSCIVLTETLFFSLQLCGLLFLVSACRLNRWHWFAAAAMLFGAATFVRGVTLFWPGVVFALAVLCPRESFAGSRKRLIGNSCVVALLMGGMIVGWSFRNFTRHGVFTFSEGGVLAARYFWTARTLASFDPDLNTRGMQHKMEAAILAKYGPDGTTFAEHHRDDLAVFQSALRQYPWPMAKRFVKSALQNATRGSELHAHQLPQFNGFWDLIKPFIHKQAGGILMALTLLGGMLLLVTPERRAAGLILMMTYLYLCGITGFEFWQGSRICYPAQMAWAILVAVVLDRTLGLAARYKSSRLVIGDS